MGLSLANTKIVCFVVLIILTSFEGDLGRISRVISLSLTDIYDKSWVVQQTQVIEVEFESSNYKVKYGEELFEIINWGEAEKQSKSDDKIKRTQAQFDIERMNPKWTKITQNDIEKEKKRFQKKFLSSIFLLVTNTKSSSTVRVGKTFDCMDVHTVEAPFYVSSPTISKLHHRVRWCSYGHQLCEHMSLCHSLFTPLTFTIRSRRKKTFLSWKTIWYWSLTLRKYSMAEKSNEKRKKYAWNFKFIVSRRNARKNL